MSKAQEIRDAVKAGLFAGHPAALARRLKCPEIYVLRVSWPETYRSVKAGQRRNRRKRRAA